MMNKSKMSQCVSTERTEPITNYDEYLQAAYEQQTDRYNEYVKNKKQ